MYVNMRVCVLDLLHKADKMTDQEREEVCMYACMYVCMRVCVLAVLS